MELGSVLVILIQPIFLSLSVLANSPERGLICSSLTRADQSSDGLYRRANYY